MMAIGVPFKLNTVLDNVAHGVRVSGSIGDGDTWHLCAVIK